MDRQDWGYSFQKLSQYRKRNHGYLNHAFSLITCQNNREYLYTNQKSKVVIISFGSIAHSLSHPQAVEDSEVSKT